MKLPPSTLEQLFAAQIQALAPTLRPSTLRNYRVAVKQFLSHLRVAFPTVPRLHQLRRDPHLLTWFASLCSPSPLSHSTRRGRLVCIRRLLDDLSDNGHPVPPHLIRCEDLPALPHYLPRPLPLDDDRLLQQQLLQTSDLPALALLLMRATGIRVGECIDLSLDGLRQIGPHQWVLHVPLGKLHSERLVPVDADFRSLFARILQLRAHHLPPSPPTVDRWLLPRISASHNVWYQTLRSALKQAAQSARCSLPVQLHQLRHSFATEMIRLGVSLPALMRMLGHKDIRMTLRYVQVTQLDIQREYYYARSKAPQQHRLPDLVPPAAEHANLEGIRQALQAIRHLMEMYRRGLGDDKTRRTFQRLDRRLLAVVSKLDLLGSAPK